jgi:hypothetical protein
MLQVDWFTTLRLNQPLCRISESSRVLFSGPSYQYSVFSLKPTFRLWPAHTF